MTNKIFATLRPALSGLALFALATTSAAAKELAEADRAALEARVEAFNAATAEGDYAAMIAVVPPKIFEQIASNAGVTLEELQAEIVRMTEAALSEVTVESFSMDLAGAETLEASDGSPYVLIPTESVLALPGGERVRGVTNTLAIQREGRWYLLRLDDMQQIAVLQSVYPEFAGIEFPRGSMTVLGENE